MNCESSRQLWEKLESIYQSKGPAHKAHLLKSLILQKMKNGDDMHSPLQRFLSILTNREMDIQVMDDLVTIQLLYSVPEEYEHFRVAIETQDNIPEPEVLKTKMMEEYEARKRNNIELVHGAMFTRKNYKFPPNANTNFKFKCFNCEKIGHKAKDCKGGNQKQRECKSEPKSNSAVAMQVFADEGQSCLDSGATSHMCFQKEIFENIKSESLNLKLANDASAPVVGSEKVLLETSINLCHKFRNVIQISAIINYIIIEKSALLELCW